MPELIVIYGPMFAGKSKKLVELAAARAGEPTLVFKHQRDQVRCMDGISSHEKELHGRVLARPINSLWQVLEYIEPDTRWIMCDEAQFFDPAEIACVVVRLREKFGSIGLVFAGLDLKFTGEAWPGMGYLIGHATESYQILASCCRCSQPATHTHIRADDQLYEPRCKPCHDLARLQIA